jgi:type VI secretion system protein ImpL
MNPNPPTPPKPKSLFPKIAAILSVGAAMVATALWAIGSFVGGDKAKVIITIVIVFVAILLAVAILVWLLRKIYLIVADARARRLEMQASAPGTELPAQEQKELDALLNRLKTAVRAIRESKLAKGRKPDEAIYALPWVFLMGPPESGKTATLRESGVDFPYTTIETRKSHQEAVSPACEFWFSRRAVVLDSTGYLISRDMEDVFGGFLDELKRIRRARPLDAAVIAISAAEIMNQSPAALENTALDLKKCYDGMCKRLGARFPVYIVFTKCDQMKGFQDFFGKMHSKDRAQVWGSTISRSLRQRLSAEQIFGQEFDRLAGILSELRLQLLAGVTDPVGQARIYAFPAYFLSLKQKFSTFLGTLLQTTPYTEKPLFRGFYFTSAPAVSEPVVAAVQESEQWWEPGKRLGVRQEQPKMSRSYFLEDLLSNIIFADRPLAAASMDTRLKRRTWLDISLASIVVLSVVLLVGMIFSFVGNRDLIESTRLKAIRLTDAGWDGRRTTDLMAMEDLRKRVEELDKFAEDGPPWALRWGLYSGTGDLLTRSRRTYLQRLHSAFVRPTAEAVHAKLQRYYTGTEDKAGYDELYTLLKSYLTMTDPGAPRGDASFLGNAIGPIWKTFGPSNAESASLNQLNFYARLLPKNHPELQADCDKELVRIAQRALSQAPAIDRIYTNLKNQGNAKVPPFTLAVATSNRGLDFLISSHDVPGVFTEAGWSTFFKASAAQASQGAAKEDWVLGPYANSVQGQADANYQKELLDRYFSEYDSEWQKFLEGLTVRPLRNLDDARAALNLFSQPDSPISKLLMNVAANTMLRKEPEKSGSASGMVSGALATLGLAAKVNREDMVELLANDFQPLHELVISVDGKSPSTSGQYIEALGKVHGKLEQLFGSGVQWEQVKSYVSMITNNISGDEFQNSFQLLSRIKQQCRTNGTRAIGPFLEQPLRQTWSAILQNIGLTLDGRWKTRISEAFRRDIMPKYPFNPGGQDLPLAMLSQYLRPSDGFLWSFYDTDLKMFLSPAENRWQPAQLIGAQVNFSPQFLNFMAKAWGIRLAFYGTGGTEPSLTFDLTPGTTPDMTESLLEIDGQRLIFQNTASAPSQFAWPGKLGSPMARLSIGITRSSERLSIPAIEGEWALFRLMGKARMATSNQAAITPTWTLASSDGRKFDVRYTLRVRSLQNPFTPDFFSNFDCPERITSVDLNPSIP